MIEHGALQRVRDVITEVDDYKTAVAISRDLQENGRTPADAFEIMTQWVATLREYYCEIGRQTAEMAQRNKA